MNKVKIGFFSFTEITDPAEHHSYNEWHQLDHMPEQYPLAGLAFGQRWVSTPACRSARAVDGPLLAPLHYVTLYLMTEPVQETLDAFLALGGELRALGRFHEHRRALLSGPFDVAAIAAAPGALISAEAVPYRPNRGAYIVVEEAPGADDGALPAAMLETPGVAGVWSFRAGHGYAGRWRPGDHRITVGFLDEDPLTVAPALGHVVAARDPRTMPVIHAGPLETVTPWQWDWFDSPE
jgi:hypothetical protein